MSSADTVRERTLPEELRYLSDRIYKSAADYAISDIQNCACVLWMIAQRLEQSDGTMEP